MSNDLNLNQAKALKCPQPEPRPQQTTEDCCEAELKVIACCKHDDIPRLYTRTIQVDIPAGTPDQVQANALGTVNALEANGWLVLAHSMIVPGATSGGLKVLLTLGWYA